MDTRDDAKRAFADAVALWRFGQGMRAADVIDAAAQALALGLDSPTLRELAGESPQESWFVLNPVVEQTADELGTVDVLAATPQRAALEAMVRRFQAGALSARELTSWAHFSIGHAGDPECLPLVELDDVYDTAERLGCTEEQMSGWAVEEVEAFLAGRPSPRSGSR